MVSIVNGYTCFTTCDAAAAKQGRDPSKPAGTPPDGSGKTKTPLDKQATVFGGALKDLLAGKADPPSDPGGIAKPTIDMLV